MPGPLARLRSWMPSADLNAAVAHVAIGVAVVLAFALFAHRPLLGVAAVAAWAAVKEFGFDIVVERDGWRNGLIDAAGYMAGANGAFLAVALSGVG